ncbi:MAG: hypothetical protein JSW26_03085 [Desulfobacterales bacterium]|nr:MAG: hypothetical protein JSW26_03085 [Desulfobacterales bacterium]
MLLALSQAALITGTSLLLASSAIVGLSLAGNKSLATLPLALLFLAQMATTIPASLYMARVGRRLGFMTSSMFGLAGAAVATGGVFKADFSIFCIGTTLIGVFNGFGQYYRFTAAEVAADDYRSRAISYVMAGGVIAAFAGPNLANWSRHLNFLFVGATTLLTETYAPNEKAKAQALNDFIVFGTVTLTSFSSGAVQHALGWQTVNIAVIPFLMLVGVANLWLRSNTQMQSSYQ